MNKEFIPYEQALELKELGFDIPCLSYYEGESFSHHLAIMEHNGNDDYFVPAPLYQQAFRWLYQQLNVEIGSMPIVNDEHIVLSYLNNLIDELKNKQHEVQKETSSHRSNALGWDYRERGRD